MCLLVCLFACSLVCCCFLLAHYICVVVCCCCWASFFLFFFSFFSLSPVCLPGCLLSCFLARQFWKRDAERISSERFMKTFEPEITKVPVLAPDNFVIIERIVSRHHLLSGVNLFPDVCKDQTDSWDRTLKKKKKKKKNR